jgi:hypothetical protein
MDTDDSILEPSEMARARDLLETPDRRDPMWPALVAAMLLACTSVVFAAISVLAPPVTTEHVARGAPN